MASVQWTASESSAQKNKMPSLNFAVKRQAICRQCEHAKLFAGAISQCGLCGCIIKIKIGLPGQHCQEGKW